MSTVYIAGPMSGLPDFNRAAFHDAARALTAAGYDVINPADLILGDDATWMDYMRAALCNLSLADQVAMLPGWRGSRGARLEVHIADALGIPVAVVEYLVREVS